MTETPIASATAAEAVIRSTSARYRPKWRAASLPRMLAGIASNENTTLTVAGPSQAGSEFRAATKVQKATIQVRMP